MPFFSKSSKKKEKTASNSGSVNTNDGPHMVHSTSLTMFAQERTTVTTERIQTRTIIQSSCTNSPFVTRSLNSLSDKNGATNFTLNKSLLPSSSRKDSLPSSIFATKPPYKSSISTDATSFTRAGVYKSTPPRTAFSGNPISTSRYRTTSTSDAVPIFPSRNNNIPVYKATNEDLRQKLAIKVQKSIKFFDDPKLVKVPTYKTRSKSRGRLLLINNMKFVNEKQVRKGAELDEVNVVELFKQMGFQIERYRDLNKEEMMKKITNFRGGSSLKKVDIGTVIIMSHGTGKGRSDSTEVVCTDGKLLETTWIINQFNSTSCPYLSGKPKIFIFQCCRGDNVQTAITHTDATLVATPRQVSDVLVAYSTVPGFVSHRDPQQGTWYIQAICKVFMEHAHDTDVESLLKIVDSILSKYVSHKQSNQTSSYENMGFKTCYFHPQLSQL